MASIVKNAKGAVALPIREKAYLYLRRKILSGELRPGTALSEASIARELGNSRGPLREAIRQLTAEGFLCQTPNRGSVVVEFSRRDIAELYELREALEVYAVGRAAEHTVRPADLQALEQQVREILVLRDGLKASRNEALDDEQMARFIRIDLNFHTMVVRAAMNGRILKVFGDTRVLLNIFGLRRRGHDVRQLAEIHQYHAEILAAVVRKDPDAARRLLGQHIRVSRLERLKEFDEREREAAMGHPLLNLYDMDLS